MVFKGFQIECHAELKNERLGLSYLTLYNS